MSARTVIRIICRHSSQTIVMQLAALMMLAVTCCLITGCGDDRQRPGVIASVNGEAITLQDAQTLLDSRFSALGTQASSTLDELKANYCHSLKSLIISALVRQELEEKSLGPSDADVSQAIDRIASDYKGGTLDQFLDDAFLRLDDWRKLMKDHLALEIFRNQILLPNIKIEFEEAKNYYQEHQSEFTLPETVKTCFLASENREALQEWCANVADNSLVENPVAQCVEIRLEEVPQPWNKELKSLRSNTCGKIREEDGEWQSIALLERHPARVPELSEIYALVEKILLEPKQTAAFESWLSRKLAASRVLITKELRHCMADSGNNGK